MKKTLLLALTLAAFCAARADAAFINIDDSDLNNITISAGDFEEGFYIDGVLFTSGLGFSATVTLADGGHTISGSWIDLGLADGTRVDLLFSHAIDPTAITSGIEFGATSDGILATLNGSFGGYAGFTYFFSGLPTLEQNGQTANGGTAFLSVEFKSEAVPEPATLLLVGSGLLLAVRRRRRA